MIRKLTSSDYIKYLPLISSFRETHFSFETFSQFLETIPNTMEIWIYEEGSEIIGTITIIFEPKLIFNTCTFAHIEDVCVAEFARKQGIGSKLLEFAIQRSKDMNCRKITLDCADSLVSFYSKNRFERRGNQMSILLSE